MIEYKCTRCGARLESPESAVGQQDNCPACGIANTVPTKSQIDKLTLIVVLAGIAGAAVIVAAIIGWQYYSARKASAPQQNPPAAAPVVAVTQPATAPAKPAAPAKPPAPAPKAPSPAKPAATRPAASAPAPEPKPPTKEPATPVKKPPAPQPKKPPPVVELPADPDAPQPKEPPTIVDLPADPNAPQPKDPPAVVDLPADPDAPQPKDPPAVVELPADPAEPDKPKEPVDPQEPAEPEPTDPPPPPAGQTPAPAGAALEAPITSQIVSKDPHCKIEILVERTELIIPNLPWATDAAAEDFGIDAGGKVVPCRGIRVELASAEADDVWVLHQPVSPGRQKLQKIPGSSERDAFTGKLRVTMVRYVWMYPQVPPPPVGRKARIVLLFPGRHPAPVLRFKGRLVQDQTPS